MSEEKQEFKLSLGTRIKGHVSTALTIFGVVGTLMAKDPGLAAIALLCLMYGYLFSLDHRQSKMEEVFVHILKGGDKPSE